MQATAATSWRRSNQPSTRADPPIAQNLQQRHCCAGEPCTTRAARGWMRVPWRRVWAVQSPIPPQGLRAPEFGR